jgi:hypothetical protein
MDGFYAAYLTGQGGNTVLLLAIKSSSLIGVDAGGLKYTTGPSRAIGCRKAVSYLLQATQSNTPSLDRDSQRPATSPACMSYCEM